MNSSEHSAEGPRRSIVLPIIIAAACVVLYLFFSLVFFFLLSVNTEIDPQLQDVVVEKETDAAELAATQEEGAGFEALSAAK